MDYSGEEGGVGWVRFNKFWRILRIFLDFHSFAGTG